jgi:tRNA G18 (ribose-2'-O)-methylase SpoU
MNGESLFDAGIQSPAVYVMGSESHGISDEIKSLLMKSLTIPGSGQIESLNVGVAAGILCAEIFRKSLV